MALFCRRFSLIFICMKPRKVRDKNPFFTEDTFKPSSRQKIIPNKGSNEVYNADGEVHTGIIGFVTPPKLSDRKRFTKVYQEGWRRMMTLSNPALRVLFYIISEMDSTDTIDFTIRKCIDFTGYKDKNSIYRAIRELKDKGFISETSLPKVYMINPLLIYNGNRLELYKELVRP